jgi:hypothetical protein
MPPRTRIGFGRFGQGFVFGLSLGVIVLGLALKVYTESPFGEATVAIGTVALAAATVWLGIQTLEVSRATRQLGQVTNEELELLRAQAEATKEQATTMREQLGELREGRFAEILPMLRWQQPEAYAGGVFKVLLTNEGPGPARLLETTVESNRPPDVWAIGDVALPSTLPSNERIVLTAQPAMSPVEVDNVQLAISIRYGDLLGEFEYETRVKIAIRFRRQALSEYGEPVGMGSTASFIDSDERSALQRRVPKRSDGAST